MSAIINYLFETNALRVAEADQPFWYTSGLFGPYYVNTHFLFGSEHLANNLLALIDEHGADTSLHGRESFPEHVTKYTQAIFEINGIYKDIMRISCDRIRNLGFDYISGGERRDFFFSNQIAWILGVPHISIFKNGDMVLTNEDRSRSWLIERGDGSDDDVSDFAKRLRADIAGKRVLHIADLVTQASSYTRAWIPAIEKLGARMEHTLAVVDRNQGGGETLAAAGVRLHSLAAITDELFLEALQRDLIDQKQLDLVRQYAKGPETFIRSYVEANPDFLRREREKDEKTAERVERLEALGILK